MKFNYKINPQSPIPNPQKNIFIQYLNNIINFYLNKLIIRWKSLTYYLTKLQK